ncbi:MAG: metal ABC transporter ATP-binding protein [Anaerolineae bacterium]
MSGSVATPPLIVERLSASYNGALALRDVSFALETPERLAVIGPNGAGKTTLFRIISGVQRARSGRVLVHGHAPGRHICVAYVPQRSEVDWNFPVSVADVVMMGRAREIGLVRWPGTGDRERVEEALAQVGIAGLKGRPIGELSVGQQHRVFLAQAVAQEAELALLDEPFTGLDTPSQRAILDIIDQLQSKGVTVLVATHDLQLALEHFDRVLLLNRDVIAFGDPEEVLTQEALFEAYRGHLHLVSDGAGLAVLDDAHHSERRS